MIRNIIRYVGLTLVIVGIVLVMKNLFATDTNDWNSKNLKNNVEAKVYYDANIELLDEETKKPIVGSKMVLKNATGEVVDEWVTEDKKHTIIKLEKGAYVLEQVSVVDGYEANKKNISFKITDSDKNIVMYNAAKVEEVKKTEDEVSVESTSSSKSFVTIIIAIGGLLAGIKLVLFSDSRMIRGK